MSVYLIPGRPDDATTRKCKNRLSEEEAKGLTGVALSGRPGLCRQTCQTPTH